MNNLAQLLKSRLRLQEAEPLLREACQGCKEVLGEKHIETLRSTNNLATLLKDQGKREEAEELFREALAGCRETVGDSHPNTIRFAQNLAALLAAQGRSDPQLVDIVGGSARPVQP